MWEVRRGKKVPEKKKWKVEKEEMYNILVCDDDREIVDAIEIYPVSYTHLDVYKRQKQFSCYSPKHFLKKLS